MKSQGPLWKKGLNVEYTVTPIPDPSLPLWRDQGRLYNRGITKDPKSQKE